ncbi:hypothetical protein FOC34_21360 [Burkholderia multivorans]|uniref:hypothetical protein n=1 Tax=Burkholderia multivorans TaxID=87883 RepID=UPI0011B28714|nr:hypothetical protein [Burkholderia multivorans]QGR87728.1 hypothetical protein FOC34_21360 [Burkholderia multivorans]
MSSRPSVLEMFDALDGPHQQAIPLDTPGILESLAAAAAKREAMYAKYRTEYPKLNQLERMDPT